MQSIQDPCQPKASNQYFCQIKTHLAVLCALWLFSTWRKCDAVNRSWQIQKSERPSNFSRYCNEVRSWQHSGIHTVLQLPSNLSSVGSSAPSAISCKYGISPKQGLVYLITVLLLFYKKLRHMQSIQDPCQPKPSNQYFCQIKTHLAVLCAVWLFSTWRKCDAVNWSWQIKKSKRPSNFSRYCNEMTSGSIQAFTLFCNSHPICPLLVPLHLQRYPANKA